MVTYILLNGGSWKVKATVEVSLSKAAFFYSRYYSQLFIGSESSVRMNIMLALMSPIRKM